MILRASLARQVKSNAIPYNPVEVIAIPSAGNRSDPLE